MPKPYPREFREDVVRVARGREPMGIVERIARLARTCDDAIRRNVAAFDLQPDEFDVLATLRRSARDDGSTPAVSWNR